DLITRFRNSAYYQQNQKTKMNSSIEEVKTQVKKELAIVQAQALIRALNENCFKMCFKNPGSKLSSSDETCLSNCVSKYLDAWDSVSRVYLQRIQTEQHNQHSR
ncbi:hypothetical protein BB560_007077, partial [Smittium megazygosporum]